MTDRADLDAALADELERWRARGLWRELPEPLPESSAATAAVDFTGNDYLGLARHPYVVAGARTALEAHGAGGRASRLLGGGSELDRRLEADVADWIGAEAALLFPSGYHANLGVLGALAGPGDRVLSDALNHASLIDGMRLSRATAVPFPHGDLARVRSLLAEPCAGRTLVVTEGVFSMDGDRAPLAELAELCAERGAVLVVDEAHAIGLLGPEGAGAFAAALATRPVPENLDLVRIVTGGKALGAAGALVCGSARLRDLLVNRARSFAFTTAAPPAVSGALAAAVELVRGEEGATARERCRALARRVAETLALPEPDGAIVPVVVGDADRAMEAAERLRAQGLLVRAVRPPTVPEGSSRLRVVLHANNTDAEVERLIEGLRGVARAPSTAPEPAPRAAARPLFVTGTDTDIGKTVVAALLARGAARYGPSAYWKPVQTGLDSDTETVARLCGIVGADPGYHFPLPASPHEAAADAGGSIDPERVDRLLDERAAAEGAGALITELAGGLLVPLTDDVTQLDWLARRRPELVLVARSGLGTLNHTLLSLEALARRHLRPRALFLVGPHHPSNFATLKARSGLEHVLEVPTFEPLDTAALDAWLDLHPLEFLFA